VRDRRAEPCGSLTPAPRSYGCDDRAREADRCPTSISPPSISLATPAPDPDDFAEVAFPCDTWRDESEELRGKPWYRNQRYLSPALLIVTVAVVIPFISRRPVPGDHLRAAPRPRQERFGEQIERALTRAQRELDAGLLVVGSQRSGSVARSLHGGGATGTVARSGRSVLVVRGPAGARAEG
jgi:hypothetical protein